MLFDHDVLIFVSNTYVRLIASGTTLPDILVA